MMNLKELTDVSLRCLIFNNTFMREINIRFTRWI